MLILDKEYHTGRCVNDLGNIYGALDEGIPISQSDNEKIA